MSEESLCTDVDLKVNTHGRGQKVGGCGQSQVYHLFLMFDTFLRKLKKQPEGMAQLVKKANCMPIDEDPAPM